MPPTCLAVSLPPVTSPLGAHHAADRRGTWIARRRAARVEEVALDASLAWSAPARRRPIEVAALDGEVMVTFEGDPEDHVLAAGGSFRTPARGRVAITAFCPSRVRVTR